MIGRLSGTLIAKQPPLLLLDVHGVGYEVEAPMSTFFKLPAVGETVVLQTHLVVREDAHLLFGFATAAEKSLFREIIKITGIGARMALSILSGMTVAEHVDAVLAAGGRAFVMLQDVGRTDWRSFIGLEMT